MTSPEYAEMLGYDPATFSETAAAWNERLHPDDLAHGLQAFDDYVHSVRADYDLEYRQRARDGRWVWIHSVGCAVAWNDQGRPTRMIGIHTDITARKEAELAADRQARLYRALSLCNEAIVRSTSPEELFPQVCRAAVDTGVVDMAWVAMADRTTGTVRSATTYGARTSYLDGLRLSLDPSDPSAHGPVGIAIRENRPVWFDDVNAAATTSPLIERIRSFGWVAMAAVPLRRAGAAIGALAIYSRATGRFDPESRKLLTEMAADISFASGRRPTPSGGPHPTCGPTLPRCPRSPRRCATTAPGQGNCARVPAAARSWTCSCRPRWSWTSEAGPYACSARSRTSPTAGAPRRRCTRRWAKRMRCWRKCTTA